MERQTEVQCHATVKKYRDLQDSFQMFVFSLAESCVCVCVCLAVVLFCAESNVVQTERQGNTIGMLF